MHITNIVYDLMRRCSVQKLFTVIYLCQITPNSPNWCQCDEKEVEIYEKLGVSNCFSLNSYTKCVLNLFFNKNKIITSFSIVFDISIEKSM